MYDRLTEKTRQVISFTRQEAQRMGHNYTGTEHLLLGIVRERTGMAATVLDRLGVDAGQLRRELSEVVPAGTGEVSEGKQFPFAPRARQAFERAVEESRRAGQNYIGTEHLLLGLLQVGDGPAAQTLERCGVGLEKAREAIAGLLSDGEPSGGPSAARIEARLAEVEKLAGERADDALAQAFRVVLACYCDEEVAAVQRGDYKQAYALRGLYDRTVVAFRELCGGQAAEG